VANPSGGSIIKQTFDVYRKVRGTVRYLLGNIADFDPAQHTVPYEQLPTVDRLTLSKLYALMAECKEAYDSFQFYKVFQVRCRARRRAPLKS
jgi:isoleucyl-tRNA synthetase